MLLKFELAVLWRLYKAIARGSRPEVRGGTLNKTPTLFSLSFDIFMYSPLPRSVDAFVFDSIVVKSHLDSQYSATSTVQSLTGKTSLLYKGTNAEN